MVAPVRVVFSGAAGQIGYALAPRLVNGESFGLETPVDLVLFDLPVAAEALKGVAMELTDCAFPLLNSLTCSTDAAEAFADADYIVMLGSMPRGPGMDRADLLRINGGIFKEQGAIMAKVCKPTTRVLVVGNPANTNGYICAINAAPTIPKENFMSLSRLDHNRLIGQLAERANVLPKEVEDVFIFGNHSNSMVPVYQFGKIAGKPVMEVVEDHAWMAGEMTQCVKTRGAAIIKARGRSSAASAASGVVDTLHSWHCGTDGRIVSSSVITDGSCYDVPAELMFSLPMRIDRGKIEIVKDFVLTEDIKAAVAATVAELEDEKAKALA